MDFERFKCLSFDCYGTLIDWESGIASELGGIVGSHGIDVSRDELLELFGRAETEAESGPYIAYKDVLRNVLKGVGNELGFLPTTAELDRFSKSVKNWPAFPDSAEALQELARRFRLMILSNIDDDLFRYSEKRLGVEFDSVFTAQRIGSYKPSRRNFEYLVDNSGVAKNEILHVAQSLFHDIGPAGQMGISTVWINRRVGLEGSGATPPADARPGMTFPDLGSFAEVILVAT